MAHYKFIVIRTLLYLPGVIATFYFVLVRKGVPKHAKHCRCLIPQILVKTLLKSTGMHVQTEGMKHLKALEGHPFVIFCNHNSRLDPMVLIAYLPFTFKLFRSNKDHIELERLNLILWFLHMFDMTFLHDKDNIVVTAKEFRRAAAYLREDGIVSFFPEGRFGDGNLLRFGNACTRLAIEGIVPIVPIALTGTDLLFERNGRRYRPGVIKLTVCEPISTSGLRLTDSTALADQVRDRIGSMLNSSGQSDDIVRR